MVYIHRDYPLQPFCNLRILRGDFRYILPLLRHQCGFLFEVSIVPRSFYFLTVLSAQVVVVVIFFMLVNVNSHPQNMFFAEVHDLEHTLSLLVKTNSGSLMQTLVRGNFHTCSFVQTKLKMPRVRYKQGESECALPLLQLKNRVEHFSTKPDRGNKMVHDHRFPSGKDEMRKYLDCQHNMAFKFLTTTNYPCITQISAVTVKKFLQMNVMSPR